MHPFSYSSLYQSSTVLTRSPFIFLWPELAPLFNTEVSGALKDAKLG
jgi:hypothetical protein